MAESEGPVSLAAPGTEDFRAVASDEEADSAPSSDYSDAEEGGPGSEPESEQDLDDEADELNDTALEEFEEPGDALAGKNASIAKAFAKILQRDAPQEEAEGAAEVSVMPAILQSGTGAAKRKAEESTSEARDKAALKQLQEMKRRGRVAPRPRGQDPAADAEEKRLQKSATRGVVRLFNAIATAQRKQQEGPGADAPAAGARRSLLLPGSGVAGAPLAKQDDSESEEDTKERGWAVLQKSFTGLEGRSRARAWDRGGEEEDAEDMEDPEDSDSE
ncbi:hypothetical protein QBZ16_000010 [Prototheca wickerhamii]|uniref:RRP15-like protein n=1 Tax=Prototheca wickerhamii TaxID=3111 RepID=A0AAD9IPG7_PROWI|nr:hypothetical protein QBZ16_000010 [Prototheca wickerhamii]